MEYKSRRQARSLHGRAPIARPRSLIAERPDGKPNPAVEVRESLPDGTEFKAVWSQLLQSGVAKLVTVHFYDRG